VEGLQTAVGELGARFEEARTGGNLQSVVSELSSRLETEHARALSRLDALEDQLVGSAASGGRLTVLEERVTAIANSANEARASAGDVRSALDRALGDVHSNLDKAVHDLSGRLETRTAAAETASADTIAKAVDDRIASIDGLRTAMSEIATRVEEEQARAWKRIDELQEHTVSKSYIDERLNVMEWMKAEQLRGSKRLDEMFEQFVSKAYIDERLHSSDSRLQHLESVRQQESASMLAVPGRSDYDDISRRLDTVEKSNTDVQELRWRQEAFTSNLDMLARRLQEVIDENIAADARMQEAAAREAAARESAAREAAAKEAASKEAAVREAVATEAASKEAAAKEAAAKEVEVVSDLMRECVDGLDDKIVDLKQRLDVCAPLEIVNQLTARMDGLHLDDKISDLRQRLDVCAPLEVVNQLTARMDGGFDALVVQLEATRWMMQKTEEAGDHIMQAFVLNVDERLHQCEDIISKHSEYLQKRSKQLDNSSALRHHHGHHGHTHGRHTSRSRSGKHIHRTATKEAIEKAEASIVSFWFDVWARGPRSHSKDSSALASNVQRGA